MKLVIFGAVVVVAVVFGSWFWGEFIQTQDELASPVSAPSTNQPAQSAPANAASIESELNGLDLTGLDAEASEMDLSGL